MKIKCVLKVRRPPENGSCEENDKAAHGGILKVGDLKLTRPADFKVKAGKDPTDKKCNLKPPTISSPEFHPPANFVPGRWRLEPHCLPICRLDVLKVVKVILERARNEFA